MSKNPKNQFLVLYALGVGLFLGWLIGHSVQVASIRMSSEAKDGVLLSALEDFQQLF